MEYAICVGVHLVMRNTLQVGVYLVMSNVTCGGISCNEECYMWDISCYEEIVARGKYILP